MLRRRSILQSNLSSIDGSTVAYQDTKSSAVPKVSILKEVAPSFNAIFSQDTRERKVDHKLHDKIRTVSQTSYYKNMHTMTSKFDKNLQYSTNLDNLNRNIQKSRENYFGASKTMRPKSSAGCANKPTFDSFTQRRV